MPKTAFIVGSGFHPEKFLKGFDQQISKTQFGNVMLFRKGKIFFLLRHGKNNAIPPHRINHRANICALNLEGVEKIIGINSTGSLKATIKPGSIVIPNDYVDFSPQSFFDFELRAITPELDSSVLKELKAAAKKVKLTTKNTGVYVQTLGPRFETKAEISIIKKWGDLVGMTLAKEATLAQELGIKYAAVCAVDNFANGISKTKISMETLKKTHAKTQPKMESMVKELIRRNK